MGEWLLTGAKMTPRQLHHQNLSQIKRLGTWSTLHRPQVASRLVRSFPGVSVGPILFQAAGLVLESFWCLASLNVTLRSVYYLLLEGRNILNLARYTDYQKLFWMIYILTQTCSVSQEADSKQQSSRCTTTIQPLSWHDWSSHIKLWRNKVEFMETESSTLDNSWELAPSTSPKTYHFLSPDISYTRSSWPQY